MMKGSKRFFDAQHNMTSGISQVARGFLVAGDLLREKDPQGLAMRPTCYVNENH